MSATRVVAKSVFTCEDLRHFYPTHRGITFFNITRVTCNICGGWDKPKTSIVIFSLASWDVEVYNNKYYIIPNRHKNCKEIFKLCPPLE